MVINLFREEIRAGLKKGLAWIKHRFAMRRRQTATERVETTTALARERGDRIPITVRGSNPCQVIYTVGEDHYFFTDLMAYKAAIEARRVPHLRSTMKPSFVAPRPISRWSAAEMKAYVKGETPDSSHD